MKKYSVTIDKDGVIILPEEIVEELNIKEGQEFLFEKKDNIIIMRKNNEQKK